MEVLFLPLEADKCLQYLYDQTTGCLVPPGCRRRCGQELVEERHGTTVVGPLYRYRHPVCVAGHKNGERGAGV